MVRVTVEYNVMNVWKIFIRSNLLVYVVGIEFGAWTYGDLTSKGKIEGTKV